MFRSSVVSASTPSSAHSARIAFTCSASASRAASRRSVSRLASTRHRARAFSHASFASPARRVDPRRAARARARLDAIDPSFVRRAVDRAVDRVGRRRTVVSLRLLGEFRLEHASLARVERHGASRRDATRRAMARDAMARRACFYR
jgi:hypothetical protein